MMRVSWWWKAVALVSVSTGCQSTPTQAAAVPAVLAETDKETQAEIAQAVSRSLGGVPVTLSSTAFTRSPRLFIDQGVPRNDQSGVQNGRLDSAPRRFELLMVGNNCYLAGPSDDMMVILSEVKCKPVPRQ